MNRFVKCGYRFSSLHNAISGLFGIEEPVFFSIAVLVSPLAFAVGLVGSLVFFVKGLVH